MIERVPPKAALWLLEHWGSPYHGESLAGDLIEQYQDGRSRTWYWKQVGAAILVARWRRIRLVPWSATGRVLSYLLAETAAVLAVVVTVDRARRTHSLAAMLNVNFVGILIVLITVALIGFLVSMRPSKRKQRHAAINALLLIFGVIALGAGTLTLADTLRGDARQDPLCPSQQRSH
jgi:ABC-type transport system involved in cytochrome c biogenesis permease subunit